MKPLSLEFVYSWRHQESQIIRGGNMARFGHLADPAFAFCAKQWRLGCTQ